MKTNLIILAMVVVVLVFASGCNTGGNSTTTASPFLGGTNGLIIAFAPNAPPEQVYDSGQYPFDIDVKLKNAGETKVNKEDVRVKISGIYYGDFNKSQADLIKSPDDDLEATTKLSSGETREGTESHVVFSDLLYTGNLSGDMPLTIRADVCYKYQTLANAKICVRQNMLDTTSEGVCTVSGDKVVYSSRAPVQVVSFSEQSSGKNKLYFTFNVRHDGNGRIYAKGTMCNNTNFANKDKVWVTVSTGLSNLRCTGLSGGTDTSGYVKLYAGQTEGTGQTPVTCTQQVDTQTDYEKNVDITLDYDYEDDNSVDFVVKKSSQ